ncbi:glycine--tRNA ligase [Nanoarchaeota archaeon]
MAYVIKKIVNGRPYYYLKQSKRLGNRVVSKTIAYFGKKKPTKQEIEKKLSVVPNVVPKTKAVVPNVVPKESISFKLIEKTPAALEIDEMAVFCKKKGFVYPAAEIYGGLSGFFDYGPLGTELNNAIKASWWKKFVQDRDDVIGIDGSVITHQKIWEASGHLTGFSDLMITCSKCNTKVRADQYLEEHIKKGNIKDELVLEGITDEEINKVIKAYDLKCPKCKSDFKEAKSFNLMFPINVGAGKESDSTSYLRGETAQVIFANFKLLTETNRLKLPFGIAQVGKAFRNEISPRDFLFRVREFEQMEIEFFVHPEKQEECPYYDEIKNMKINYFDNKNESQTTIDTIPANKWLKYWLGKEYEWFLEYGITPENLRVRQHSKNELAHYATSCFDIEYKFPFGWKEIYGNADRGCFDLSQHQNHSKKSMEIFDEETKQKVLPVVASEPSQGVGRAFLAFLFDAYTQNEKGEIVLRLDPRFAPTKAAVFPLVNKPELIKIAKEISQELGKEFNTTYDQSGSVGRRYARNDEAGTPYCITVDFDSLKDKSVTIRDRNTTEQKRVKIEHLREILAKLINKT